jgi:hypothetical protein
VSWGKEWERGGLHVQADLVLLISLSQSPECFDVCGKSEKGELLLPTDEELVLVPVTRWG